MCETRRDPARGRGRGRELDWWLQRIRRLRRHREGAPGDGGPASYDAALTELHQELTAIARTFESYRRTLGDDMDEALENAIVGTSEREGLLQAFEHRATEPKNPGAFAAVSLERRLIDLVRRQEAMSRARAEGAEFAPALIGGSGADLGPPEAAQLQRLPREVAECLEESSRFAAVALELAPRLHPDHPLRLTAHKPRELRESAEDWSRLGGYLGADVDRGRGRRRWSHHRGQGEVLDWWSRAWLATYYRHEGRPEFLGPDEIPADKRGNAGALFYQHKKRFRERYSQATSWTEGAVERHRLEPVHGEDGRPRLPLEWERARHPTLDARDEED